MKKRDVLNLIRYHCDSNDMAFRDLAASIAAEFAASGDVELADYITAQLSDANAFVVQSDDDLSSLLTRVSPRHAAIAFPEAIEADFVGIKNAISRNAGLNKFLLQGPPGTGKTEAVKLLCEQLDRELLMVDFDSLIDSKLGETGKNVTRLFEELRQLKNPQHYIVLFDEVDAIALDRVNSRDVREMGRVTSAFLRELDKLDERICLFATTNLFDSFDKALTRRFDACVDFSRYTRQDLIDVAIFIADDLLRKYTFAARDKRLLERILQNAKELPYPGEVKNIIKTAIAFSDVDDDRDYLRRIYKALIGPLPSEPVDLRTQGFTVREVATLLGMSKTTAARAMKGGQR